MSNDGGPAFPEQGERGKAIGGEGMSMRDWFAGMAMQGLLSSAYASSDEPTIARLSYQQADAMIAEREKAND